MNADVFQPFEPCGRVWPCGQYSGASTTCQLVCSRCWGRLTALGDAIRDMQDRYASGIADAYGPGVPSNEER